MKSLKLLVTCACLTGWFSASALAGSASSPASGSPAKGEIPPRKWSDVTNGFASVNAMDQNGTTGGAGGKTVTGCCYRFHLPAAYPFRKSLRLTWEHGSGNHHRGRYRGIAYYYLLPPKGK